MRDEKSKADPRIRCLFFVTFGLCKKNWIFTIKIDLLLIIKEKETADLIPTTNITFLAKAGLFLSRWAVALSICVQGGSTDPGFLERRKGVTVLLQQSIKAIKDKT